MGVHDFKCKYVIMVNFPAVVGHCHTHFCEKFLQSRIFLTSSEGLTMRVDLFRQSSGDDQLGDGHKHARSPTSPLTVMGVLF
jgi:hypothetical protein